MEKITKEWSENFPEQAKPDIQPPYSSDLTFNILSFCHPAESKDFYFTTEKHNGWKRFHMDKLPEEAKLLFPELNNDNPYVYTDFTSSDTGIVQRIDMKNHRAIAEAFYTLCIRNVLQKNADVINPNFLNDTQFWYRNDTTGLTGYHSYSKFTLKVQQHTPGGMPELLITYDGLSYTSLRPLSDLNELSELNPDLWHHVIYQKRLYSSRHLPEAAKYHPEEIFPVLNRKLTDWLKISIPLAVKSNRYPEMYQKIHSFYSQYLDNEAFRKVIPITCWKKVSPENIFQINNICNDLVFGEGKLHTDVHIGLKANGPYRLPECNKIHFFMIFHEENATLAETLYDYLTAKKGFLNLNSYTRLALYYDRNLNITFHDKANPLKEIHKKLFNHSLSPDSTYYAFYLSPYTRFEPDPVKRNYYYKLKEMFLQRHTVVQVIEQNKLKNDTFKFSISNIGIAMISKTGGIPWRLNQEVEKELIVGFGAFCTQQYKRKYIGSAFCFSNDGTFREFDCFPANETWALAGTVADALQRYRNEKPDVERLIIHFYKKMSEKELYPIEKKLRELHLGIPVIIVSIYKTLSENHLVFDNGCIYKMPLNGSYFQLGNHQYLLCVNQRDNETSVVKTCPLLIKLELQSNDTKLLDDPELVERLMKQVYSFCFMHWRTVKQPPIPVTVRYPEMLAQMFPWFDSETLPEYGKKTLWFL